MRQRAFTLMEILVATAAMAILLIALYEVFSRGVRLRDRAVERVQEMRLRERALAVLRRDLRHALVTGARLGAALEGSADTPASRFPGYLRLTTATAPTRGDAFHADLQEVEYYIVEDIWSTNQNSGTLVRTLDRNLMSQVREISREETLLHHVASMEVAFLDGEDWVDSWDFVDTESPLPLAVQVTIQQALPQDPRDRVPPPIQLTVPWSVQRTAESAEEEGAESEEGEPDGSGGEGNGDGGGGPGGGDQPGSPGGGGR